MKRRSERGWLSTRWRTRGLRDRRSREAQRWVDGGDQAVTLPAASLGFAGLALTWSLLARARSERWWPVAALDLVPPQLLLPWPLGLALRAARARRWTWAALNVAAALAWTAVQVGLVLPRAPHAGGSGPVWRVLTLNTRRAGADPERVAALARRVQAGLVLLQEVVDRDPAGYEARLREAFPGWQLIRHAELISLTRSPVLSAQALTWPHTPHAVLLVDLEVAGQTVRVIHTHLPTLALRPGAPHTRAGRPLPERAAHRLVLRRAMLAAAAEALRQTSGPVLLAGDLNAPPRGQLHRWLSALGLTDVFRAAGRGFGLTYHARFGFTRIDYLWTRGLTPLASAPLPDVLSDHRPLLAELRLP